LVSGLEVFSVNKFSHGCSTKRFLFLILLLFLFLLRLRKKAVFYLIIMGVGGHKHHYNVAHIEKEMKGIGDAVCLRNKNKKQIIIFL
jgi:hypothetical protein